MSYLYDWRAAPLARPDTVAIPRFWVTLLLSVVLHVAMLGFLLPRLPVLSPSTNDPDPGTARTVLVTRLAPIQTPTTVSPPPPPPPTLADAPALRRGSPPAAAVRRSPAPPVIVSNARPTEPLPPAPPPIAAPAPPRPPAETDLAAYVEARRRARGDPTSADAPPPETETERLNKIVAANLAPREQPTFGYDPKTGGGIFQLARVGYDDAEFYFTGWNKDIGRRAKQLIEVRKGSNDDIRHAIVRKMIAIIRAEVQDEFTWVSARAGQRVTMSARPRDNAVLEEFLMQEFFPDSRRLP